MKLIERIVLYLTPCEPSGWTHQTMCRVFVDNGLTSDGIRADLFITVVVWNTLIFLATLLMCLMIAGSMIPNGMKTSSVLPCGGSV